MGDNEWYTRVVLPYAQTDQIHLAWNEWPVMTLQRTFLG